MESRLFVTFRVAEIVTAKCSEGRAAGALHLAGARHCNLIAMHYAGLWLSLALYKLKAHFTRVPHMDAYVATLRSEACVELG